MRILHANKFAYRKGGAETYMIEAALRQRASGDDVAIFGGLPDGGRSDIGIDLYPINVPDYYDVDGVVDRLREFSAILNNRSVGEAFSAAIEHFKPDVVHLHNYAHQLSPAVVRVAQDQGVSIVHTAHDYKLICPAYVGSVRKNDCFSCAEKISVRLLTERCHHGSLSWSAAVGVESLYVRSRSRIPRTIIAPSRFMEGRLRASWLKDQARIEYVPNPSEPSSVTWQGGGGYVLYVGRLSREKGLNTLLDSAAGAGLKLVVAGDGPLRAELEVQARNLDSDVEFVGHVGRSELDGLRARCIAQIIPSEWPENAPLSLIEAAASSVPVVGSRRGGIPEYIEMGARLAVVDEFTSENLADAVTVATNIVGDLVGFRNRTSWGTHLNLLSRVYARAGGAL